MGSLTILSSLERPTLSAQVARHILALIQRDFRPVPPGMAYALHSSFPN